MEGVNSSMIYLIYCKNFYKCHNVPPSTTIKKKKGMLGPWHIHREHWNYLVSQAKEVPAARREAWSGSVPSRGVCVCVCVCVCV
jgi:hypothetical protein